MAFKLDKGEIKRKDDLVTELQEAAGKLEDALAEYNAEVSKQRDILDAAIATYNETIGETRGFVEDIAAQADGDISDKSERWQDSDNGAAAIAWKDEWENASFDEVSIEDHADLGIDGVDHANTLDQLPTEAG